MRLIHTSDIHLNSALTSRLSAEKTAERKRELIASFRAIIDKATEINADGIIIAGDLFDTGRIPMGLLKNVITYIAKAGHLVFFYLPGNHEKNAIRDSGIELPDNLRIFGEDWTYYDIGGITVVGRSTTAPGMFGTLAELHSPAVAVLHGEVRDKSDESGGIGLGEAKNSGLNYVALGHYHSFRAEQVDMNCVAVYSGTPEGRGFDETGDKGYVVVDIDEHGRVTYRFVKHARRTIHELRTDISGCITQSDVEDRIEREAARVPSQDLLRVVLIGERTPQLWHDRDAIKSIFEDRYYYFDLKDESRLKIDPREYENDKSLKGEFIRTVLSDASLDEDEKSAIIECGLNALMNVT